VKTTLGIILGVLIGFLILVLIIGLLTYYYFIPAVRQFSTGDTSTEVPVYSTSTTSTPTTSYVFTPEPSQTTGTPPASTTTKTTVTIPSETQIPNDVEFVLNIIEISGNSLSPTISAEITNAGSIDAQNTWAKIEVFSRGKRIKLGGEEFLRKDLGTLEAGIPAAADVTLSFSLSDASVILASGARLDLTIVSDQKTQNFSYNYEP
jgi:hypothetical protein